MTHERSVLVVYPPFICPAGPPPLPALAAASLRGAGALTHFYDANHDFFFDHLLNQDFLQKCLARVQSNSAKGVYQGLSDYYLADQLEDIAGNQALWQDRCTKAQEIPGVMRGEGFYDPGALVAARSELDALLSLASLAYFPLRMHWNGLHHPDTQAWDAAWSFIQGPDNPFHSLSKRFKKSCQNAQPLVFCVQHQDQLLPALTLWADIKEERPDLEAVFWGPGLNAPKPPEGITWLSSDDPVVLCSALKFEADGAQPLDYDGLENYLAPEPETNEVLQYRVDQAPSLDALKEDKAAGVVLAGWVVGQSTELKGLEKALRISSRAGMWNRVELVAGVGEELTAWCAANPNLAHSITTKDQPGPGFCGPPPVPLPSEPMVGTLPPMPGRPLWRWLDQEAHLALYLRYHGVRQTRLYRVREDETIYQLGGQVEYHFVHYPDLNEWHVKNILELITSAGRVKPDWLRHNLERAFLIAYALEEGAMVATETLKHPRPEYIRKVRERTGLDFTKHLERGYIVVRPDYRGLGIGDHLIKGCLARAPGYKTFLAIAAENKIAQELTARHGSRFLTRYYSEEMGKEIEIWTPKDQDDLPDDCEAQCR